MAVTIARLKERIETDLSDDELTAILAEANAAVTERFGTDAAERTMMIDGDVATLDLLDPIDENKTLTVTEFYGDTWGVGSQVLASTDYRIRNDGRTLERIASGAYPRGRWGVRVQVVYTPISRSYQRDEVVIKLCHLAIEYRPLQAESIGGHSETKLRYAEEREQLLATLMPRGGMVLK